MNPDNSSRIRYHVEVDWTRLPKHKNSLEGIDPNTEVLRFRREKNSHRGISKLENLRSLIAFCVNQDCLEEIAELPQLETLYISELTASEPSCLKRCSSLRHLVIKGGTKVSSVSWLCDLPPLEALLLEHFKLVSDFSAVSMLPNLRAVGIEGSMWATQHIDSFRCVTGLPQLEALFLTNCRPKTGGMEPLMGIKGLRFLEIAAFFPDADFLALRRAVPTLQCDWFDQIDRYGSIKAAIQKISKG